MNVWEDRRIRLQVPQDVERPFSCGDLDLDDFLRNDSLSYSRQRLAVNYVMECSFGLLAYFSLANDRISIEDFHSKTGFNRFRKRFVNSKRICGYPAVKLCRLAVNGFAKGNDIGTDIVRFLKASLYRNSKSACRFLTVDAYKGAVGFYLKNGFHFIQEEMSQDSQTVPMYFDLADLDVK